jgi:serine protease Do
VLQTDITGSENAGGILFNLKGHVIGVITNKQGSPDMKNMVTAYGITELKNRIEKMANGKKMAYMGIYGVKVTSQAYNEWKVPFGVFVTEIDINSPAMLAGIQQGDVITYIDGREITSYTLYSNLISSMNPGDTVKIMVMRQVQDEYKEMEFTVVLKEKA